MLARRAGRRAAALATLGGVLLGLLLWAKPAAAYPWMIRHEYSGCGMCHADPSGGGVLTAYGRAQGDLLMRIHYDNKVPEEPDKTAGFLWGAWEPPEWLLLGGDFRDAILVNFVKGAPQQQPARPIEMQTDLRVVIRPSIFRAGGSIGYVYKGGQGAALVLSGDHALVSREHWVGVGLKDDAILLRAGRMNLPFGIRNIDHTLWVRSETRTDINKQQQHGVSFAYSGDSFRTEVMALLGNYQIHPDAYRERGAAGYFEYTLAPRYAVGVSGLFTTALADINTGITTKRGSAGVFGRFAPKEPIVISTEVDALITGPAGAAVNAGVVGTVQLDYQPRQGVHLLGTGELRANTAGVSAAGWLGAWAFLLPHVDLRVDGILQSIATPAATAGGASSSTLVTTFLAQIHAYL
jgi:hypothetical protein